MKLRKSAVFGSIFFIFSSFFLMSCSNFFLFTSKAKSNKDISDKDIISDEVEGGRSRKDPFLQKKRPFSELSDDFFVYLLENEPETIGSLSVGYPNSGSLVNGVQMPEDPRWDVVNSQESWGTTETAKFIITVADKISKKFPDADKIHIGDISYKDGGRLGRHVSHQAGRDVDLGWYYKNGSNQWWTKASKSNLDLEKSWTFIRSVITDTDVEMILIDKGVQEILYNYALNIGENKAWLDDIFQYPKRNNRAIIRHAKGHRTHMHVRFYNPIAQEAGRRAYTYLVDNKLIQPTRSYAHHKVKKGQTLGYLAKDYRTSVSAIKQANSLKSNVIRAGKLYRIPQKSGIKMVQEPISIPERRLPSLVLAD